MKSSKFLLFLLLAINYLPNLSFAQNCSNTFGVYNNFNATIPDVDVPDNSLAISHGTGISTQYLVSVTNAGIEVFNTNGNSLFQSDYFTFFGETATGNEPFFDPRVVYDYDNQRFIIVVLKRDVNTDDSFLYVRASNNSNPLNGWFTTHIISDVDITSAALDGLSFYRGFARRIVYNSCFV